MYFILRADIYFINSSEYNHSDIKDSVCFYMN